MTTTGTVKEIKVTGSGNRVTVTNDSPPPPEEEWIDVPDWALRQFQTALAGSKTVVVDHEGGSVGAVTVKA